jgi:hypothetical protein
VGLPICYSAIYSREAGLDKVHQHAESIYLRYREKEREMNKFCKETAVGLLA